MFVCVRRRRFVSHLSFPLLLFLPVLAHHLQGSFLGLALPWTPAYPGLEMMLNFLFSFDVDCCGFELGVCVVLLSCKGRTVTGSVCVLASVSDIGLMEDFMILA